MGLGIYCPLAITLAAVPVLRGLPARLGPAAACWILVVSAALLTAGSTAALALPALAGASTVPVVAGLGAWSTRAVWRSGVVDLPLDTVAAAVLAGCALAALVVAAHRAHALLLAFRAAREAGGGELVVTGGPPDAHALPGRRGRIVVSRSMLAVLDAGERQALLAHERAHLACRHYLFVVVLDVLSAANPLLLPLRGAMRYAVERWADEAAAEAVGARDVVARAIGRAALACARAPRRHAVLAMAAGAVPRRVAALVDGPAPARRSWLPLAVAVAVPVAAAVSGLFTLEAGHDLHAVLEMAQAALGGRPGG